MEEEFQREYLTLLAKYKVRLVTEEFSDEWGTHSETFFTGPGVDYEFSFKIRTPQYVADGCTGKY